MLRNFKIVAKRFLNRYIFKPKKLIIHGKCNCLFEKDIEVELNDIVHFNKCFIDYYRSNLGRIEFHNGAKVHIGKKVNFFSGNELSVSGELSIGDNCYFNNNLVLEAHNKVIIGDNTFVGPNVRIADTDFHRVDNNIKTLPIIIGSHVWIGGGL